MTTTKVTRVGYCLNLINSNSVSDSTYQLRFLSISSFDSNVVKNEVKHLDIKTNFSVSFVKHLAAEYHEQKSASYIKTGFQS